MSERLAKGASQGAFAACRQRTSGCVCNWERQTVSSGLLCGRHQDCFAFLLLSSSCPSHYHLSTHSNKKKKGGNKVKSQNSNHIGNFLPSFFLSTPAWSPSSSSSSSETGGVRSWTRRASDPSESLSDEEMEETELREAASSATSCSASARGGVRAPLASERCSHTSRGIDPDDERSCTTKQKGEVKTQKKEKTKKKKKKKKQKKNKKTTHLFEGVEERRAHGGAGTAVELRGRGRGGGGGGANGSDVEGHCAKESLQLRHQLSKGHVALQRQRLGLTSQMCNQIHVRERKRERERERESETRRLTANRRKRETKTPLQTTDRVQIIRLHSVIRCNDASLIGLTDSRIS